MRSSNNRGLESPCINTKGAICPKRRYPRCMRSCQPMTDFQEQMRTEVNLMKSSNCEGGSFPIVFQDDGVAYR